MSLGDMSLCASTVQVVALILWFVNIWDKPPSFDIVFIMESRLLCPNFPLYQTDIFSNDSFWSFLGNWKKESSSLDSFDR